MISNYIVPSVFLLIVIICGIVGMKKGFVKQLAGMVSFIISALLAYIFCDPLANVIQKMPFVQTMITDVEMPDFSGTTSLWDKIQTVLTYAAKAFNENGEVSYLSKREKELVAIFRAMSNESAELYLRFGKALNKK